MDRSLIRLVLVASLLLLSGCGEKQSADATNASNRSGDPVRTANDTDGAASAHATTPPKTDGDVIAWGEPANGLQAGLSLKSTSQEPRATAVLVLHLRNAGNKPLRVLKLSERARYWGERLPIEVRRSGEILKYKGPVLEPPPPPPESGFITLNPSGADSTEVTLAAEHWKLAAPFDVQIAFVFKNDLREDMAGPFDEGKKQWRTVDGLWTGEARSQAVNLKMGP